MNQRINNFKKLRERSELYPQQSGKLFPMLSPTFAMFYEILEFNLRHISSNK